jgi:hypothetical protein
MKRQTISDEAIQNGKSLKHSLVKRAKNPPSQINQLRLQAANALCKLRELAKSDLKALEVLATELRFHVAGLKADALQNPNHYGKLISKCATWPAFVSAEKEIQKAQHDFAVRFGLGADAPLNYRGKKQWSRNTPEVRAALMLIEVAKNHRMKLPPLNRENSRRFWRQIKPMFISIYGKNFETHPAFAKGYNTKVGGDGLKRSTWVRKVITSNMAQAFRSIARK